MTGLETSYLAAWLVLATVLAAAGGLGYLLALGAVACGVHRAHVWPVVRRHRRTEVATV